MGNLVLKNWVFFQFVCGLCLADAALGYPQVRVQVEERVPQAGASVGVGSKIKFKIDGGKTREGLFLGQLVKPNGRSAEMMFLDTQGLKLFIADRAHVEMEPGEFQKILRLYDQVENTCTGYAIHHYFGQTEAFALHGNDNLKQTFSSEKGRTQFLVRAINDYYLMTKRRYSIRSIMSGYGKEFGLRCEMKVFTDAESARQYLIENTQQGVPVLLAFNIGPDMVDSKIKMFDLSRPREALDPRLWVPRKVGERKSGGHSIVSAGFFKIKTKPYLVMLDSDWSEPRVWDLNTYIQSKTALKELEFYSCR